MPLGQRIGSVGQVNFYGSPKIGGQGFPNLFPNNNNDLDFPSDAWVAITGHSGWRVDGGGVNGGFSSYLGNAAGQVNDFLSDSGKGECGAVVKIDLDQIRCGNGRVAKKFIYSHSPNFGNHQVSLEEAKRDLEKFGKDFAKNCAANGVTKIVLPFFSGSLFAGRFKNDGGLKALSESLIKGFADGCGGNEMQVYLSDKGGRLNGAVTALLQNRAAQVLPPVPAPAVPPLTPVQPPVALGRNRPKKTVRWSDLEGAASSSEARLPEVLDPTPVPTSLSQAPASIASAASSAATTSSAATASASSVAEAPSSSAATASASVELSELEKRKEKIIGQINKLYDRKRDSSSAAIRAKWERQLDEKIANADDEKLEEFLKTTEEVFADREKLIGQRKNILRQLHEIDRAYLYPAKVGLREYEDQFTDLAANDVSFNPRTTDWVKNRTAPIVHVRNPSRKYAASDYHQNVIYAGYEVQDDIDINFARLSSLIEKGVDISDEVKAGLSGKRSHNRSLKAGAGKAAEVFSDLVQYAGRGIFSESKAIDGGYNQKYRAKKEQLMSDLLSKMDIRHSNYQSVLAKFLGRLETGECDLLDLASYNKMKELIAASIESEEKQYKEKIDALDKSLGTGHEAMLKEMQGHEDKEDEIWKYRALSLFLIFTPLGAFSIAGQAFSYLDPIAQFIGPLFDSDVGFSEALGKMVTSDQLGFIGDMMEGMKIDDAIEGFLNNVPLVDNFCDIVDAVMDSQLGGEIFANVVPFIESPMTMFAAGAGFAYYYQVPNEIEQIFDKSVSVDKHQKALKDLFENHKKAVAKGWDSDIHKFFLDTHNIRKEGNINLKMCEFFLSHAKDPKMSDILEKFFGDARLDVAGAKKNLRELYDDEAFKDKDGTQSVKKMLTCLNGDKGFKDKLNQRFLLLAGIDREVVDSANLSLHQTKILSEFERLSSAKDEAEKLCKKAQAKFDCQVSHLDIDSEITNMRRQVRSEIPSPVVKDPRYAFSLPSHTTARIAAH